MADYFLQATLSNFLVAAILAMIAWIVQIRIPSGSLANLLWALVLIKLLTPPLFSAPLVAVPSFAAQQKDLKPTSAGQSTSSVGLASQSGAGSSSVSVLTDSMLVADPLGQRPPTESADQPFPIGIPLGSIWLFGSSGLLLISLIRIGRFHHLLVANSKPANELAAAWPDLPKQIGLNKWPRIYITGANIAPFVWWMSGCSTIVLPKTAIEVLKDSELRLVVAHEMGHIKRRDHCFRWLEWLATVLFWWNPLVWWARRQLRVSEELACDELVLETTHAKKHYAKTLLNMAELLTASEIRPPTVASAFNSGGNLENRLKMIIAEKTHRISSRLRTAILAVAACVFPLGLVYAQDFEAVERRLGLAVHEGELSLEQAQIMMEALRQSTHEAEHKHRDHHGHDDHEDVARRIATALAEAEVEREAIRPAMGVIRRLAGQIAKEGNRFDLDAEVADYLHDELGLNREQIGTVVELAERLADAHEERGNEPGESEERDDDHMGFMGRISDALAEADIEREAIRPAMGVIRRLAGEIAEQGNQFKLSDEVANYLEEELGFNREQIELVVELAEWLADEYEESGNERDESAERDDDREGTTRRIAGALAEAGVEGEATRPAMRIIRRLAGHIAEQGNSFKFDEETVDRFFGETNFNRDQVRVIVALAERLADSLEEHGNEDPGRSEDRDDDNDDGMARRIAEALAKAGVERQSIRPAIGVVRRLAVQIAEQGNGFELSDEVAEYLQEELGLNRAQIGRVVEIAERLADSLEEGGNSEREDEERDDDK